MKDNQNKICLLGFPLENLLIPDDFHKLVSNFVN